MLPLFLKMLNSSRQWLRQISPAWLNQEIQFPQLWDPPVQEQVDSWEPYLPKQAFWERTQVVRQVFKELGQSITEKTYPEIQTLVQQNTGTACSKKVIARFKREQGIPVHPHPLKKPILPMRSELLPASPNVQLRPEPDSTKPIQPQRPGISAGKGFKPSTHSRSRPRQLRPRSP